MAGIWRDQDKGYSSLEDENPNIEHPAEQTPAMVIDAALARLRARAGCQEDSFVRQLSTSLLSRMARNVLRNWETSRSEVEDGQQTEMPDFIELVTEELRRFGRRSEIADEYNRRNAHGSLEHDELAEQRRRERGDYLRSPRRRLSHSRSMDDPTLDLDILQPVRIRSSPDSPISPMKGLTDPEELRNYQRTEPLRIHRRRPSRRLDEDAEKEERRRLRRIRRSVEELESSMSPKKTYPGSGLQESVAGTHQSEEQEIPGEVPKEDLQKSEELPSLAAEGSVTPEESSTPSDELLTSVEENVPTGAAESAVRAKGTQKDKNRRKKRTRKVIEGFSNRQITSLRHLNITRMDALELIIQLSVSMDRLDRLINGPRNREAPAPDVDDTIIAQFFDGLEVSRTREIANRVSVATSDDSPSSSIPKITEKPRRDPRCDDI